jgi:L-lactate dehydrogenase complex protein LldF
MAGTTHATRARRFLGDVERAAFHDRALWEVRKRRDRSAEELPEWETLRSLADQIKAHSVGNLAHYLEQFEENAARLGAQVHFARDAQEHNAIVLGILQRHGARHVVKSKSMLTEECGLNPWLEQHGLEVTDTDLGELIVQLRHEPPSHIVLPAIHLRKEDVAETFRQQLGVDSSSDPKALTETARAHLRQKFLRADAGITGVNFAIAESGGIVVCTNEGNADLGTSLPALHIACMGLEKIVPRVEDLGVFLRLLARSATGQAITSYTSFFHGPRSGSELHIVIVDNGRTRIAREHTHRRALHCIRCGACLNTCPVYRRSGGHSYATTVPGPIGSILAPLREPATHQSLPHACTLCGSCAAVCPVKIDLDEQLLVLRQRQIDGPPSTSRQLSVVRESNTPRAPFAKRLLLRVVAWGLRRSSRFRVVGRWGRRVLRWGAWALPGLSSWTNTRMLPAAPRRSFREQLRERSSRERHSKQEDAES